MARWHIVFKHWWMRGLKHKENIVTNENMTAVEKFKGKLRCSETEGLFGGCSVGLLMYVVAADEFHAVSELLQILKRVFKGDEYTRRLESRLRKQGYASLGIPGGTTTLMAAMMTASTEVISMLLECGANIQSVDVMGNDAFMLASAFGRPKNLQFWLKEYSDYNLEQRNTVLGATALVLATNMGANKIDTVRTLCKSGARIDALTHAGFSVLMAACANEDSDPAVVKLLIGVLDRVEDLGLDGDINHRMQSKSTKWKMLRGSAKIAVRSGFVNSVLARRLANGPGLTALHYAARRGDVEIVTLLLEAGADPYIKNEMGMNSFDISEKFGPFPSVKKALEEYCDQKQ